MMFKLIVAKLVAIDVVAGSHQDTFKSLRQGLARQLQGEEKEEEKNCETACELEGGLEKVEEGGACNCKNGGHEVLFEPIKADTKNHHGTFTPRVSGQWQKGGCHNEDNISVPLCFRRGLPKTKSSKEECAKYCVEKVKDKVLAVGYSEEIGTITCKCFFHSHVSGSFLRPNEKSNQCYMIPTDTEVAQGKVDEATDVLNVAQAELDSVKTQFAQVEEVAAAAEGEVQSLQEEIDEKEEGIRNREEEIKRISEEMEKEKKDMEKKKGEMEKAKADLDAARVKEEKERNELKILEAKNIEDQKASQNATFADKKAWYECDQKNDNVKTKKEEAAAAQKKIDDLKKQLAEAEVEGKKAQEAIGTAQVEADSQNEICIKTKNVMDEARKQVSETAVDLKQAQLDLQEMKAEREEKERLQDEVEGELVETETSIKTMNEKMEEEKAKKEEDGKQLAQLEQLAQEKKENMEKAQADLTAAGASKDKEEAEYNQANLALKALEDDLAAIRENEQNEMDKKKMLMQQKAAMMKK